MKDRFKWIYYVARRFSLVDLRGSGALSSRLSTLGICFGVMTLIIVISVMNGFQREFIDAIMEVSSFHARAAASLEERGEIEDFLKKNARVSRFQLFAECEALAVGPDGRQAAVLARGVSPDIMERDAGFRRELKVVRGTFDLAAKYRSSDGSLLEPVALGASLARAIGAKPGDEISLYSLNSKKPLLEALNDKKAFVVAALFMTGYADINSSFAFVDISSADFFGEEALSFGIKLKNPAADSYFVQELNAAFPDCGAKSWREYNRSFFGALRVEKNALMLLVVLIFVVVAVNIYNSMRRIVYERRFEISILSALGGRVSSIRNIFIMRGFLTGVRGALPGLVLGMFFCVNIKKVFAALSASIYFAQSAAALLFAPETLSSVAQNPMFAIYGSIPARMYAGEIIFITLFGIFSAVFSSWAASRNVLKAGISEVLHDE